MPKRKLLLFASVCMLILGHATAQQQGTTQVVIAVVDPSGAPVPGTEIRVIPAPDPSPKMETDAKGQLGLTLKPGGYALFARCQGFQELIMHFDVQAQYGVQTVRAVLEIGHSGSPIVLPSKSKDDLVFFAYPYHEPVAYSPAEIKVMPHISVTVHNPHVNADETYSGVRLSELLSKLGAPLGKELHGEALNNYIVATGSDGYSAVLALAEVDPEFHPGEVIVADSLNGKPLDEHSGPLKLVVTEDKRPARSVRNLVSIELRRSQ